ncbi:hypothetical protein LCGC14_1210030 [marine sediment metagenome]|uniref:Uncharacterized protein n=1 Tax=marine sediment metagenome TaxID=412755 RepID=A0A0F9M1T4_9ZZZZ
MRVKELTTRVKEDLTARAKEDRRLWRARDRFIKELAHYEELLDSERERADRFRRWMFCWIALSSLLAFYMVIS